MIITTKDIKEILSEEMRQKKIFSAKWDTACDICGEEINTHDDTFIFMGNKKKICGECEEAINKWLEE